VRADDPNNQDRIESIVISEEAVQISYIPSKGFDRDSGIVEMATVIVPQEVLETGLFMDLIEAAEAILDEARTIRRKPIEKFQAPR
jgi:hypothetical protein